MSYLSAFSQNNLVPNNSFEIIDSCYPQYSWPPLYNAPPWFLPTWGSSDAFHECSWPYVPDFWVGYQYPVHGLGYGGIIVYYNDFPDVREYMETPLTEPLKANHNYCLSFFISLADKEKSAIDRIGIEFTKDSLFDTSNFFGSYFPIIPDIETPEDDFITDTSENWLFYSFEYIAEGGEKYMTIGNFRSGDSTNFVLTGNPGYFAYYIFDVISLYEIDTVDLTLVSSDTAICDTNSTGIKIGVPAVGGYTYNWYPPYGLDSPNTAQPLAIPDSTTTYYLTVTDTFRYRCRQGEVVAIDTVTVTVTKCIGIDEIQIDNFKFRLYPNPTSGNLKIDYELNKEVTGELEIYDISGREKGKYILQIGKNSITAPELQNGIYFYEINVGGKMVMREKIVVIK